VLVLQSMKAVCAILITILVVHVQCGASCLVDSFRASGGNTPVSVEPPCHQHGDAPDQSSHPSHEKNNPCGQGTLIEAKVTDPAPDIDIALFAIPAFTQFHESPVLALTVEHPPGTSSLPITFSNLRI
jgi:hypothetical protein